MPSDPQPAPPVFRFEGVGKTYEMGEAAVHALREVALEVASGEFLAILGPSGSGKSTLMHIMGLMDQPSGGRVWFDGEDVTKASPSRRAALRRNKIGFVFQAFNLLPRLSVLENVAVPLLYQKISQRRAREAAAAVLDLVGLGDRVKHMPNQLSGGQRQRVAIARALVNDPRVILADEPTGNLDSASAGRVLEMFHELHGRDRTIILVTHDPKVAATARDRVLVEDGRARREGNGGHHPGHPQGAPA
jgi:putative ABC transport system ATP-binding protein